MKRSSGFTLLEIMISIVILSIALTLAWQMFSTATSAWTGSRAVLDRLHHGDFVLSRLAASLRSMATFESAPEKYGFRMDSNPSGAGGKTISWVTSSSAFIPRGETFEHGLYRIEVGEGEDDDGNEGLIVSAWPHLADEEEVEKKNWLVSDAVLGLDCAVFDVEEDAWEDRWEKTNEIPGLVTITLYVKPLKPTNDPLEISQLIEIPLGPAVTNEVPEAR